MASEAMNRGANPRDGANVALSFNSRTKDFESLNGGAIPPDAARRNGGFPVRYCHAVRSHPETRIPGDINYGSLHKWEKRQIAKVNRRYARSLIKKEVMTYVVEQQDFPYGCVAQ